MITRSYLSGARASLASRLNKRITLQEPDDTADGAGGVTKGWSDFASVWAEITPYAGNETLQALQIIGTTTHRITIRYVSGVATSMRIAYGSRIFNIRAIANPEEAYEVLVLEAEEGVAT